MKLEELARQSSGAARASVAHLDAPALGADARNRGRMPVLLGAAAVLLVVGLGTFLLTRDDTAETVTAGSGELPTLGLAEPESFGLTATGALNPDDPIFDEMTEEFSVTFVFFGTPGAEDPYAAGDLMVGEIVDEGSMSLSEGTPVTVRGVEGVITDPDDSGTFSEVTSIEWLEPAGDGGGQTQMIAASRVLSADELVAVADGLDLSAGIDRITLGEGAERPAALEGFDVVAVSNGFPSMFASFRAPEGPLVAYERAETVSSSMVESVAVWSSPGDLTADSVAADRWWASSAEPVQVGGNDGWLFTWDFGATDDADPDAGDMNRIHTVTWQWAPGVLGSVTSATQGGGEFALEVAAAVVELDPALLDDIREGALTTQATGDFDEVWGTGSGSTDIAGSSVDWSWAVGTQGDQFCTALSEGFGSGSSCSPLSDFIDQLAQTPTVVAQLIGEGLQMGVIAAGPDHIVLPAEGTPGELTEVLLPDDEEGTRLLVWVGPAEAPALFDALVDGQEPIVLDIAGGVEMVASADDDHATEETIGTETEFPMVDVASHPSAQSMGIADGFSVDASGGNGRVFWVVGTHEGESYIVADGEATFAALLPDDVTVVKPIELPDGTVWTYVVARDVPECVTLTGLDPAVAGWPDETTGGPGLVVWPIEGTADGWSLIFDRPDADVREAQLQLPDIEGSIAWPDTFCGDAAPADEAAGEGLRLLDLDATALAAMAADGLIVDRITLPEGFASSDVEISDSARFQAFEDEATGRTIAIGWRRGVDLVPDEAERRLTADGREVSIVVVDGGEVRVGHQSGRRLVEVIGRGVDSSVLLQVMEDLVILPSTTNSGATPTLDEARAALEGLPLTDALRVATEAGWRIRPSIINGQNQMLDLDENLSRVNVSITEDNAVVVLGVG
ncbi:MAG: hypothetical protein ACE367_19335 [Acidimicrobiales bacterium]